MVILQKKVSGVSRSTLERFVRQARGAAGLRAPVNVLITTSAELRRLNRIFRGADKPTDVLSFPASEGDSLRLAGEVAISVDIARENALRLRHPLRNEVKVLILHGILHLAGYDHERDNGEMARKELRLRKLMKLEFGLIERSQPPARMRSSAAAPGTPRRGFGRSA